MEQRFTHLEDFEDEVSWHPLDWLDRLLWKVWSKSGRTRIRNGYRQVFDTKENNWKFEHRVVVEQQQGSPIAKGFEVHHINGNKLDNRPENLVVLSIEKHREIHKTAREKASSNEEYASILKSKYVDLVKSQKTKTNGSRKIRVRIKPKPKTADEIFREGLVQIFRIHQIQHLNRLMQPNSIFGWQSCPRCGGSGNIPSYNHVQGGVCFLCFGTGLSSR